MALLLEHLVKGMAFVGKPVHPTLFPHPLWGALTIARATILGKSNFRESRVSLRPGVVPAYIVGKYFMIWVGIIFILSLLQLSETMLYASISCIIYPATYLLINLICHVFPFLLFPTTLAVLDIIFFPLDALIRTATIVYIITLLAPTGDWASRHFIISPIMHLYIGAISSHLSETIKPVRQARAMRGISESWESMAWWSGGLVAVVYGVVSGEEAFHWVQRVLWAFVGVGIMGLRWEVRLMVGMPWMGPLEAEALAAAVLVVCFGFRAYKTLVAGKSTLRRPRVGSASAMTIMMTVVPPPY